MAVKNGELEIIHFGQELAVGRFESRRRATAATMRRRKRRKSMIRRLTLIFVIAVLLGMTLRTVVPALCEAQAFREAQAFLKEQTKKGDYPTKLLELVEKNEETLDFVQDYRNREQYIGQPIDLTSEASSGQVPLLLQWDKRWGYDSYGDGMIGLEGCGPTCLSMIYLYLTGDATMNPRKMAEFACDQGYYTSEGTSWGLWTDGAASLGLSGREIPLSESAIKQVLDAGGAVVCSMRPGDFTTTGHFIVLRGYDEKGFFVNDPNRRSNSEKQWDFETLSGQIKNLWGISR